MAQTPEGRVKNAVRKVLEENGVYYFMPAGSGYGRAGIPDIICCVNGYMLTIECKSYGKSPTALQEREMARIQHAGGKTLVVAGVVEVAKVVGWIKLLRDIK